MPVVLGQMCCFMERYVILIDGGAQIYLLGALGDYVINFEEAMWFTDILEAKQYVDRHGIERITTVRKIVLSGRDI